MDYLSVRHRLEEQEESLSPYATRSRLSRGRQTSEEPSPLRTEFQRDRDRIIHTKAFRRLKHKTQVFVAPLGDHYVTRLTHTLEVSQIGRTIARALNLNEDLVEAIALGHDLGHPPFGHIGEEALAELYPSGFRHSLQSLRVVDHLEKEGRGLNLTWEVRQGIVTHSKSSLDILGEDWKRPPTLEAQVCKLADALAYINHDTGDAIRAGLIIEEELPEEVTRVLGQSNSERINTVVTDVVKHSWAATGEVPLEEGQEPVIVMGDEVRNAANTLRGFLFQRVYHVSGASAEAQRARDVVKALYQYFVDHPEQVPREFNLRSNTVERRALDYIAGMTDHYALRTAEELSLSPVT
ncbi:MAG: deoxyguanosinetriphosphate triphosphohydrolase [Dehalococcoidia bacterium]